jgi:acetylornithine deacetylase/succinyl-diaminopimelate desuccinylase-like protein
MAPPHSLKINAQRLNDTLQRTCTSWGALAAPSTGMCRLTLSREDKEVRDWLIAECESLGCEVKVDQMGSIFAVRRGTVGGAKPIGMGSHLDTQPAGTT